MRRRSFQSCREGAELRAANMEIPRRSNADAASTSGLLPLCWLWTRRDATWATFVFALNFFKPFIG
jgi:hypothetical protein